ncbi:MAG: ribonuclease P protein component [Pseudomonadota bacterium]
MAAKFSLHAAPVAASVCPLSRDVPISDPPAPAPKGQLQPAPFEVLRQRADFVALRRGGRASCDLFTVQARKREPEDVDAPRIGFTVTKKIGNAVVRNRIKRRLRAATGICSAQGVFELGTDYAIVARIEAKTAPFDELLQKLDRTARRAIRPKKKR